MAIDSIARQMIALMDGLWLEYCLNAEGFTLADARTDCLGFCGAVDSLSIDIDRGNEESFLSPVSQPHGPLDQVLGDEAEYAEGQHEEQDKAAEAAGVGILRQLPDDEQHVADEKSQAEGHAELGHLLFVELHGLSGIDLAGNASTSTRSRYSRQEA